MSVQLLIMAAALAGGFDCQLSTPQAVNVSNGAVSGTPIGLPSTALAFRLDIKNDQGSVDWKDSPIQLSGKQVILPTGPDAGMVLFTSGGPCLFTENACATMLNYAKQPDGSLRLVVTPTALVTDSASKTRSPFLVAIEGQCTPRKESK
jgi:hypothetical protein